MKKHTTYFLLAFVLLMFKNISAQHFKDSVVVTKTPVECNKSKLGSVKIDIIAGNNGPYTYNWEPIGATTPNLHDILAETYTLTITNKNGKDTTFTVIITENECGMKPESIFTPNDDGINDTWSIGNYQYYSNSLVLVYNRLGQKVYEHKGMYDKPWDGRDLTGVPLPISSYYYILYNDKDNKEDVIKGVVSIIK